MANNKNRKPTQAENRRLVGDISAADKQHAESQPANGSGAAPVPAPNPAPDGLTADELRKAWGQVSRLAAQLPARENALKEKTAALREREEILNDQERTLAAERKEIAAERAKATEEREELVRLKLDAENGFFEERGKLLAAVEADSEQLRAEIRELEQQRRELKATLAAEAAQERDAALAQERDALAAYRDELDTERGDLNVLRSKLRKQGNALEFDQQHLKETREHLEQVIQRRMDEERERLATEVASLERRLTATREERDHAEARLAESESAQRALDGRPPATVAADLAKFQKENDRLHAELALRPSALATADLDALRTENDDLVRQLVERQNDAANVENLRLQLSLKATEIDRAEREAEALQSSINGYQRAIAEQKQLWDDLVDRQTERSPFPQLTAIDESSSLAAPIRKWSEAHDLTALARRVRLSMALRPGADRSPLYYGDKDVRLFLAGLASSRLHLLEGISGTGKTSLPRAFATAVTGASTVVEVQAGWRDRQDLLGHYNTFERRYDETEFVQALYRAQTASQRDRLVIVVLDEMNLSHPEQYFADVLSALEQDVKQLTLTNARLAPTPNDLIDDRILKIPDNVWFVGTANHDETTKSFADKTYDRSHVQVLPNKRPAPPTAAEQVAWDRGEHDRPAEQDLLADPISFTVLQAAFANARDRHAGLAAEVSRYLTDELSDVLATRFDVGWGNRLDTQLSWFVPVYVAAGGSAGEAVDHVLATRILRKTRDRHDLGIEDFKALQETLTTSWAGTSWHEQVEDGRKVPVLPTASNAIIARELRDLSGEA